jgi:hypothetical protein
LKPHLLLHAGFNRRFQDAPLYSAVNSIIQTDTAYLVIPYFLDSQEKFTYAPYYKSKFLSIMAGEASLEALIDCEVEA